MWLAACDDKNSSGDEIANVTLFYNDIARVGYFKIPKKENLLRLTK